MVCRELWSVMAMFSQNSLSRRKLGCFSAVYKAAEIVSVIREYHNKPMAPRGRATQPSREVVMGGTMGSFFFKPEKNLEFFRLKNDPIDATPGKLE